MEKLLELMRLDEPDNQGIVYPTAVVAKAIAEFEDRIKSTNGVMGECNPPSTNSSTGVDPRHGTIDLSRVSHIVQHIWIEKKILKCKVKLLGHYAQIENIMNLEFEGVPRAIGVLEGHKVCTDYTLITVDLSLMEI